jgi:16S rRNA (guanine966-N2)-methyltransferase
MRVVAGELGGRRLHSPPRGAQVRPTSDRVREALFSIIGARVEGASVLDLCCGTGALAIEALSRGAVAATMVDDDTRPAQANVDQLGIAKRCRLVRADVVRFLRREGGMYELIFCDPPYRLADRLRAPLQSLVPPLLAERGLFIVESAARRPLALELPLVSEHRYGDTRIAIYGGGDDG